MKLFLDCCRGVRRIWTEGGGSKLNFGIYSGAIFRNEIPKWNHNDITLVQFTINLVLHSNSHIPVDLLNMLKTVIVTAIVNNSITQRVADRMVHCTRLAASCSYMYKLLAIIECPGQSGPSSTRVRWRSLIKQNVT